jgi:hypothetical protein
MARFWQRTRDNITAPAQYIQATDSVSRPMAVLASLLLFFVIAALLIGLFFAGRWGYAQLTDRNSGSSTGQISTGQAPKPETAPATNTDTTTPAGSNQGGVTATTPESATTVPRGTTSPNTPNAVVNAVQNPTAVPNTGTGSAIVVFLVATVAGTLLYRIYIIRQL